MYEFGHTGDWFQTQKMSESQPKGFQSCKKTSKEIWGMLKLMNLFVNCDA